MRRRILFAEAAVVGAGASCKENAAERSIFFLRKFKNDATFSCGVTIMDLPLVCLVPPDKKHQTIKGERTMFNQSNCSKCGGRGQVYNDFQMWFENCPKCGGSGKASSSNSCSACLGQGTIVTARGIERCLLCGGNEKRR